MKDTYLSRDFRKTVARHFPIEARELNAAFDVRLNGLLAENADSKQGKVVPPQKADSAGHRGASSALRRALPLLLRQR